MTWEEFCEHFMDKYFLEFARHAKSREFLELKQGTMMVLEYVAKFTELARFVNDYVATDMAKVRKFEDGLKCPSEVKLWDISYKTWTRWSRQIWPLREKWMANGASGTRVLVVRGRGTDLLLLVLERSR